MEISMSFVLFVIAAAFTPGPNNIMMMTSGLNYGVRASVPHLMGVAVGVPTMFLAVGFGLAYTFEQMPWLHALIQVLGVVYLLYLAWLIASASPATMENSNGSRPLTFLQAAMFQWINPKAWMLGTGAIAAFTNIGGNLTEQILTMALVFFLLAFPSAGAWLVFGSWLKKIFQSHRHLVSFNRLMAILLVISILPVISNLLSKLAAI